MGSRVRSSLDPCDNFLRERSEEPKPKFGQRKTSLRDSWKRKLLSMPPEKREKSKRYPHIKSESKRLKDERAKYRKVSAVFLARPENKWCICCTLRREVLQENITRNQATVIHHWAGRIGRLLCYVPYFKAFCSGCPPWPHEHPKEARELNLLAPAHLWEVFPGDY